KHQRTVRELALVYQRLQVDGAATEQCVWEVEHPAEVVDHQQRDAVVELLEPEAAPQLGGDHARAGHRAAEVAAVPHEHAADGSNGLKSGADGLQTLARTGELAGGT